MKENRLERLFDLIATEFDDDVRIFSNHYEQMAIVCQACFSDEEIKGKMILDAGCGTGAAITYFSRNGAGQVYGIDLSEGSLKVAKKMSTQHGLRNVRFQKANLLSLPFLSETFDIVFSCGVLPYVEDISKTLDELIRITRKDGILVLMLLKKTGLDVFYNFIRRILCIIPLSWIKNLAKFLAFSTRPMAKLFLKRQIDFSQGKPLEQTILEGFFSPVRLNKQNPQAIQNFLKNKGFETYQIKNIKDVDFYSQHTAFIIKAVRKQ